VAFILTIMHSFLCATADPQDVCERLRTYEFQPEESRATDCAMWEAARATSAAPVYFPPMEINGQEDFDGGLKRNNPILEVIREAHLLYGDNAQFRVVVSIGTGKTDPSSMGRGILGFVKRVIWATTDTEKDHHECLSIYPRLPYYRLNDGEDLANIDLSDYSKIGQVEKRAKEYIRSEEGSKLIKQCARKLAKTQQQSQ
jgi:predicted acylesterase/phospholipase RssA